MALEIFPNKKQVKTEEIEIAINQNSIFIENHYNYIPPHYKDHPPYHELKDRVVSLNIKGQLRKKNCLTFCLGSNFPPFGSIGTVIGILNSSIEVLFDEPFIGGSNLGKRCNYFRACLMQFSDVYNLTRFLLINSFIFYC